MKESSIFEAVDQFISDRFSRDDAPLKAVEKSLGVSGIPNISVSSSLRHALNLTHAGSLIVADNVIRRGKVLEAKSDDENVIGARRFLQTLARSGKVTATVVQMVEPKGHDGMAIAVRRAD